ncbi:sporulation histidine kinase inhibitor Sda [Halobacillus salinus]|nr:sporulation histidine kinase inhibitor Sda [Halobacillus salinus]
MKKLSNEALLTAYQKAVKEKLDPDFITLIETEMEVRKLPILKEIPFEDE